MNRLTLLSVFLVVGMCVSVSAQVKVKPFLRIGAGMQTLDHPDILTVEDPDVHCPTYQGQQEGFSAGVYAGVKIWRITLQSGVRAARRHLEVTPDIAKAGFSSSQFITASPAGDARFLRGTWMEIPLELQFDVAREEGIRMYFLLGRTIHRDFNQSGSMTSDARLSAPQLPTFWSTNFGGGWERSLSPHVALHGEVVLDWLSIRQGTTVRLNGGMTFYPTRFN
ncbi:MAG: hypothetical protein AAFV07_10865 [Bacteroidota bacterium]